MDRRGRAASVSERVVFAGIILGLFLFNGLSGGAEPQTADTETGAAISRGLSWLLQHQSPDGAWRGAAFLDQCPPEHSCGGQGFSTHDGALTALVVYTMLTLKEKHRKQIHSPLKQAITWLNKHRSPDDGFSFAGEEKGYFAEALASLALLKGHRDTSFFSLSADQRGRIRSDLKQQIRTVAVRRADTSLPECVVPWYSLALEQPSDDPDSVSNELTRKLGDIIEHAFEVDWVTTEAIPAIQKWFNVRYGDRKQREEEDSVSIPRDVRSNPTADLYSTYFWVRYATLQENERSDLLEQILQNVQDASRTDGHSAGSWDPSGRWGPEGGRVYATAMSILILSH